MSDHIHAIVAIVETELAKLGGIAVKAAARGKDNVVRKNHAMANLMSAMDLITFAAANIAELDAKPNIHRV